MSLTKSILESSKNGANIIDYSYYNVNIHNSESEPIKASFSENRVQPILQNPSLYEMSIVRFSVPSSNIPLLFFKDDFYVKLRDKTTGNFIKTALVYIPNSTGNIYTQLGKKPVYDYSEITESLNIALNNCFLDLLNSTPTITPTQAPFMTYDASSQLFTLNAEISGYDNSLPNTVEIIFSSSLFYLYNNLQDFYLNSDETQIRVYDTFNNTETINNVVIYRMTQSQNSLELFSDITKIILLSNSIPVRTELIGGQLDVRKRVLTDFNVSGVADKGVISFFPQGPLRYYDLLSTYPLTQIDVEFRFETKDGNTYDIFLNKNTSATCKIEFRRSIQHRLEDN